MRYFVVGCGSIGARHIRNLLGLKCGDVVAVDADRSRLKWIKKEYGVPVCHFSGFTGALREKGEKASIVSVPNHMHIKVAQLCADNGSHIFVEKPLAHSEKGISRLAGAVKKNRLVSMAACNMRFYPAIRFIKEQMDKGKIGRIFSARSEFGLYLPSWRPAQDYRKNYGARKKEGGGVILDLYHEFDYLYWFFGVPRKVFCRYGRYGDLEIDTEDNADIIFEYAGKEKFLCNLHVDYLQYRYSRSFKVVGEKGMLIWDWPAMRVEFIDKKGKCLKKYGFPDYDINNMYVDEMKYFVKCIRGKKRPMTDIKAAGEIQSIIFRAKDSRKKGVMT